MSSKPNMSHDHYGNINYVHANVIGRRPGQSNLLDNRPWLQPDRALLKDQGAKLKDRSGARAGGERLASNLYNRPFNLQRNPEAAEKLRAARESGALAGKKEQLTGKVKEGGTADKLREAKESGALAGKKEQLAGKLQEGGATDKLREAKESGALVGKKEQLAGKVKERAPAARPETKELRRPAKAKGQNNVFADKDGNVLRRDNKGDWQQRTDGKWSGPTRETRPAKPAKPALAEKPAARPPVDKANLDRQFAARQRGEQRTQQFQRAQVQPPRALTQRVESRPQQPAFEQATRPSGGFKAGGGGGQRGGQGLRSSGGGDRGGKAFRGGGGGGREGGGGFRRRG